MSWLPFNATDENAPWDADTWNVTDGRFTVEGFTRGHAEVVAKALNERDLRMALSLSRQIAVPA